MIAEGNIFMLSLLMAQPSLIVQQPPAAVEVEYQQWPLLQSHLQQ